MVLNGCKITSFMKIKEGHFALVLIKPWRQKTVHIAAQKLQNLKLGPHRSNKQIVIVMKQCIRLPKSQYNLMA